MTLGLAILYAWASELGGGSERATDLGTVAVISGGLAMTGAGVYLLVRSRNRINVVDACQRATVPASPASESHLELGWRF